MHGLIFIAFLLVLEFGLLAEVVVATRIVDIYEVAECKVCKLAHENGTDRASASSSDAMS